MSTPKEDVIVEMAWEMTSAISDLIDKKIQIALGQTVYYDSDATQQVKLCGVISTILMKELL